MPFNIQIKGEEELSRRMTKVANLLGDMSDTFGAVGKQLVDFYSTEPFTSQGGVYGQRWDRLSPAYQALKERKYPGKGVLVASGAMMNAFTYTVTRISVTIKNTNDLFPSHQLGTEKMPQRVMMLLDDTRERMVADTVDKQLSPKIEAAFNDGQ